MALHRAISCASFLNSPSVTKTALQKQPLSDQAMATSTWPSRPGIQGQHCHPSRALRAGRALFNCGSPEDAHYKPRDRPAARVPRPSKRTVRAKQSRRAVAALGCSPSPAGHCYALLGLLTAVKRQDRLTPRPASSRWGNPLPQPTTATLLSRLIELLAWARVQSSTSPAGAGGPTALDRRPPPGLWPQWRRGPPFPAFRATPGPRAALAAAAAVTSSEAGSDSDDSTLRRSRRPPRLPRRMPLPPRSGAGRRPSTATRAVGPKTRRRPLAARRHSSRAWPRAGSP